MSLFSKKNKTLVIFIGLILFHLILISFQIYSEEVENFLERSFFFIFSPIKHGFVSLFQNIGDGWDNYISLRDAQKEKNKLEKQIFLLRQENKMLKKSLRNFTNEEEMKSILSEFKENILPAQIIDLDFSIYYKSAVLNKGSIDGVKKNMIVLDKYGNLLGRIVKPVSLKESRMQLITDSESGISVYTEKNKIFGILTGDSEGGCKLEYIISTTPGIQVGDTLITSGFDEIYPYGIRVGTIISIIKTTSIYQTIKVEPFFKFHDLDKVAIVKTNFD
ncbi:MAG: rod shape-determining protein MreC [Candidatus Aminicenantaceae bacterium]